MARLFTNNASSSLAADIDDTVIQLDVTPGDGQLFPATTAVDDDDFMVTVEDSAGNYEIMRCFERVVDRLTVERAREGTLAQSFLTGSRVEVRLTADTLNNFVQIGEGGTLDLGQTGTVVAGTYQGEAGLTTNEFKIPDDGSDPTIGGGPVIFGGDAGGGNRYNSSHYFLPTGVIMMWSGTIGSIPNGWALCDGSNVGGYITPDMSDQFVRGAGAGSPGDTGGSVPGSGETSTAGAHDHGGSTAGHALTVNEMPPHKHDQTGSEGSGGTRTTRAQSTDGVSETTASDTSEVGGGQAHSHNLSSDGDHTHTLTLDLPPYFVVAYIIKLPDLVPA